MGTFHQRGSRRHLLWLAEGVRPGVGVVHLASVWSDYLEILLVIPVWGDLPGVFGNEHFDRCIIVMIYQII